MSNLSTATLVLNNGKRPTITTGVMTPELLEHFACGYLTNRENLNAKDYVAQIAYAFKDPLFSDWFQTSQEYYKSLSFTEFVSRVRGCWLTLGWEKELAWKVQNLKQGASPFHNFSNTIQCDNLLLKNTKHHLSPVQLHMQIEANLSPELLSAYD
ncbi:hypothetical protein L208DRAFT_1276214 [Tricholoma matsutake]|nr:hypothetical protein L208DRAFT_1276214 [Tricholoma matsutake 945]